MSAIVFHTVTRMRPRRYEIDGGRLRMTGKAPFKTLALDWPHVRLIR